MSAKDKLQALEAALKERGVVDVKFFFSKADTLLSKMTADVADVLQAVVDNKRTKIKSSADFRRA